MSVSFALPNLRMGFKIYSILSELPGMYPTSYVISLLLVLVLALAALLVRKLLPDQRWNRSLMPFFFLGAGFMLVETKAITELGLLFGNTWHAIGIAIIGILVMAFLGNLLVAYSGFRSPTISYMLLLATIAAGYAVAVAGGVTLADLSAKVTLVALLTGPLLFSGIVFSNAPEERRGSAVGACLQSTRRDARRIAGIQFHGIRFCLPVSHRLRALWPGVGHDVAVAGQRAMTASAASEKFLRP
jgi:hypothetical protein